MKNSGLVKILPVFVTLALLVLLAKPSFAPIPNPSQGCTPGFWKNHLGAWVVFNPADPIGPTLEAVWSEFGLGAWDWPACPDLADMYGDSLLQVLNYHGGPGVDGGARIYLRAAVAALLNASHPEVQAVDVYTIMTGMRIVLGWCDRDSFIYYAGYYDALNNLGCPDLGNVREEGRRGPKR